MELRTRGFDMKVIGANAVATWRLLRVGVHLMHGLYSIQFTFARQSDLQRRDMARNWARQLLRILGVDLAVMGVSPTLGPMMVVANHLSWLDIFVVLAVCPCAFVAKADVRGWPVVGQLVAGAGTLFVNRKSRRDAVRVVEVMAERLASGAILMIFPEGTSTDGETVKPFHPNLFQAAVVSGCPVMPMAIHYADDAGSPSKAPVYINDDTLFGSIWRIASSPGLCAHLRCGSSIASSGLGRRELAEETWLAVHALRQPDWS